MNSRRRVNSDVMPFPLTHQKEIQTMRKLSWPVLLIAVLVAFAFGVCVTWRAQTHAQESVSLDANRILVHGHGTARSAEQPPGEQFTLIASNAPQRSFKTIPPGKIFVLTDIMYNARGVNENLTVNLAKGKLIPGKTPPYVADILLQMYLKPGESQETHLCTGYLFPSGSSVMAWTNAGLQPDQWVQVAVTGYLIDERK
jgi:hypothetical protein